MPTFRNIGAQESFHAAMDELKKLRRQVCAELIWEVIPKAQGDAVPKKRLIKKAIKLYKSQASEMKKSDPFLSEYSDKFINSHFMRENWADIKDRLVRDNKFIAYDNRGVWGSRSETQIEATFAAHRVCVEKSTERYMWRAEHANEKRGLQVPLINIQVLLDVPSTDE